MTMDPKDLPIPAVTPADEKGRAVEGLASVVRELVNEREQSLLESLTEQIRAASKPAEQPVRMVRDEGRSVPSLNPRHAAAPLYRRFSADEQQWRSPEVDEVYAEWIRGVSANNRAQMFQAAVKLDEIFGRATTTEGIAGASGAFSSGTGGALIPRPLEQVILIARDRVAKMRRWATSYTMTAQQHTIPTAAAMTAYMTTEASAGTQGEPTLSSVSLIARKATVKAIATEEVLADAAINLVNTYAQRAGGALGVLEDNQFFKDGNGTAPNVSAFLAGTAFTETTSAALSYTDVLNMYFALGQAYRDNARWLAPDSILVLLSALKDGQGRPFYQNMVEGRTPMVDDSSAVGMLLGKPVHSVPFTAGTLWFGDVGAAYAVGTRQGITAGMSTELGFADGTVYWRFVERFDGNNIDAAAAQVCTGITSCNTL